MSQQRAGGAGTLGVGQAEGFDLSFNTAPAFVLDREGDGLRSQPFPVLTINPRGQRCPLPFHVSIRALPSQSVLRGEGAANTTCSQMEVGIVRCGDCIRINHYQPGYPGRFEMLRQVLQPCCQLACY